MLSSISSECGGCCMYANAGTALDANQPTRQLRAVLASQHANGGAAANQSQILLDLQHPACSICISRLLSWKFKRSGLLLFCSGLNHKLHIFQA